MRTWLGEVTTKFPLIAAAIPSKGPRGAESNQKKYKKKECARQHTRRIVPSKEVGFQGWLHELSVVNCAVRMESADDAKSISKGERRTVNPKLE